METILEKIIELAEKTWLGLDILLGLSNIKALDFIKPLLADILSDPFLLGLAFTGITIILYSIYKIKTAHSEKEKRLDALLQELDEIEENDHIDFDKPLFPNQNLEASGYDEPGTHTPSELEEKDPDSEIYGDEFESSTSGKEVTVSEKLDQAPQEIMDDDFHWESDLEEWDELYDYFSELPQEAGTLTATTPKSENKTTPSEELDQTSHAIMNDDFNWDSTFEEWDELYDNVSGVLQETDVSTTVSPKLESKKTPSEELDQTSHAIMNDDFNWDSTFEEWDELYDNVSEGLQKMGESTTISSEEGAVSELKKESAEPVPEEEESEEVAEFLEAVSELGKESAEPVSEEAQLDPELIEVDETTPQPIAAVIAPPAVPERIELSLEEIEVEPKLESDLSTNITPEPVVTKSSAGPLLKSMLNSSVSAKTDALVSRLKTFQAELETRFNSLEIEPEAISRSLATKPLRKKQSVYQPAKVSYRSKPKSRSNKEYLRQLESFIFIAKQKNQRTDT